MLFLLIVWLYWLKNEIKIFIGFLTFIFNLYSQISHASTELLWQKMNGLLVPSQVNAEIVNALSILIIIFPLRKYHFLCFGGISAGCEPPCHSSPTIFYFIWPIQLTRISYIESRKKIGPIVHPWTTPKLFVSDFFSIRHKLIPVNLKAW